MNEQESNFYYGQPRAASGNEKPQSADALDSEILKHLFTRSKQIETDTTLSEDDKEKLKNEMDEFASMRDNHVFKALERTVAELDSLEREHRETVRAADRAIELGRGFDADLARKISSQANKIKELKKTFNELRTH